MTASWTGPGSGEPRPAAGTDTEGGDRDPVLAGAIDMHVHGYPDVGLAWRMRTDDMTMAAGARACGMRGIVLKSHFWPTMDRALYLNEYLGTEQFTVFGSISLNHLVGGVSAMAVEAAALHGAKVIFMPTWSSRNDHLRRGVVRRELIDKLLPSFGARLDAAALTVIDGNGRLLAEARDVLALAQELRLVVSTGHLSVNESLALADAAAGLGYDKLIFSHPFSRSVGADRPAMVEMADRGAMVEMTHILTVLPEVHAQICDIGDAIRLIGPARVILTSDVFFPWQPTEPETCRMFVGQLRQYGLSDDELRTMIVGNPSRLLDIDAG